MPFVPFRPQESFGAWLKRHAASGTGHPAAVAAAYAADIAANASPRDVWGIMRSHLGLAADDALQPAVRQWLAESIPLEMHGLDDNLVCWPAIDFVIGCDSNPDQVETCIMCADTIAGPFPFMAVARYREGDDWAFVCRSCTCAMQQEIMWDMAEAAHKRNNPAR